MSAIDSVEEYETLIAQIENKSEETRNNALEKYEKKKHYNALVLRACTTFLFAWVIVAAFTLHLFVSNVDLNLNTEAHQLVQCTHPRKQYNATAIVSIVTEDMDPYIRYAQVLGYSLRSSGQITCDHDMVMLYTSTLRNSSVQKLEDAQWRLIRVPVIDFPQSQNVQPKHHRYLKMFSKLHVFNLTQYASVLYIDSDALVIRPLLEIITHNVIRLRTLGLNLAWASDVQYRDLHSEHNAGVMLVIPSHVLFQDLLANMNTLEFDARLSEQAYLNAYFKNRSLLLDSKMNVMPFGQTGAVWDGVKDDMHIIHFTIIKPDCFGAIYRCWWLDRLAVCRMWNRYANKFVG
jgi:alpha-N-acetylglucosamine transferase